MQRESEHVEFKAELNEQIYKEVIAFANTDGGTIFLGVDDEGRAIGLPNLDEAYMRLTNSVRDAIYPDVTLFVRYSLQENDVIRIEVGEGSSKPYYLKSKGLKPSGVYVRQGATCAMASPDEIKKMIKESDGDVFESARSLEQCLTFEAASAFFARREVPFSKEKFRGLGLQQDGLFTSLALLLSDQC
ncbi:MAG: helix-turn-helix domain-containing protein, partial [Candidatus Enteromonas sp.]